MTGTGLDAIDHVVVLMMENRSLDNVLGWLYTSESPPPRGQRFEGVDGGSIPVPPNCLTGGECYLPSQGTVMTDPNPDPGEVYADVYNQQFDTQLPPDQIPNTTAAPPMTGFVNDYANHSKTPEIIMQGFGPQSLPVMNGLAAGFAVCDFWYSSIPSQTFCNRSYVHAGTSSGYVNNQWQTGPHVWDVGIFHNRTSTVYNLLEGAGVSWRIYYGGFPLLCNAWVTQDAIDPYFIPWDPDDPRSRFFDMDQFLRDAATPDGSAPGRDGLRSYSFIEPAFIDFPFYGPENDYHPPAAPYTLDGPSNTLRGELLVYEIYQALFGDDAPNRDSTLLIVIFDEHGGTFDHVPPPQTFSPDGIVIPVTEPGGSGFDFQRLGVRVPAVLISPLIPAGTVCHTPFDHTSVIATAFNRFLPGRTLLAREEKASDVGAVLTGPLRTDYPKITPREVPDWLPEEALGKPLLDFQVAMLLGAARKLGMKGSDLAPAAQAATVGDAVGFVEPLLDELKRRRGSGV